MRYRSTFSREIVAGATVAVIATADGCAAHPAQATQSGVLSGVQSTSAIQFAASSETKAALGVATWATWQQDDGNATQTLFMGFDDNSSAQVLVQTRLEGDANSAPSVVQTAYVSLGREAAVQRARVEGSQFSVEQDDFAGRPDASRALGLLHGDISRGLSGAPIQAPPSTTPLLFRQA
jgi:hypothetical protein